VSGFARSVRRKCWGDFDSRVEYSTGIILDLLAETPNKCTFFILGWVANRHPGLVRKILQAGHEIGCHSYWHQLIYAQSPATFQRDLRLAKRVIENVAGTPVRAFRAPSFSINANSLWALDILIDEGFTVDSSIFPIKHDRYGINHSPTVPYRIVRPNGKIIEFPMSVVKRSQFSLPASGGGYFRIMPYVVNRKLLVTINRDSCPAIIYLHPWEFDAQQPRLQADYLSTRRHYLNISRTTGRFARLLQDFSFVSVSQLVATYRDDWSCA
jgi:polysaccharide deacetylase family protein (PEP-CTERM system associated)